MIKIFKLIWLTLGTIFSYILPYKLVPLLRASLAYLYTGYIKGNFASWGNGSVIVYKAAYLKGLKYISVGSGNVFEKELCLTAYDEYAGERFTPHIEIGKNCHFGIGTHITAIVGIVIKDNLLTGSNVLITDNAHGYFNTETINIAPIERPLVSKGMVQIGSNVWIGNNVCILPGVTIGDGAIVAANCVVTHDVPPYSIVAGIPARIVKRINNPTT